MAAEDPVQELCQEASCSICLEFFSDPVTLTECGHNFCQACLTRRWEESGTEPSCPQCRGRAPKRKFWPNRQLANFVEIIKKLRPSEEKGGLCEKHQEPLKFFCKEDEVPVCTVCGVSKEHRDHEVVPLEEALQDNKYPSYSSLTHQVVVTAGKEGVCQKHQESLKLFCKDDEVLICVVCDRSKEHKDHETLPLEEASEEYKDHFCSCVESLKKKRERIVAYREDVEKESQDLLKQTEVEKQETLARFSQLHAFLEEQEKLLLAQVEEVEKEVARNRDQLLARLSEELSALESLVQEMEEKSQQPASDLLQDVQSTLKR
ncbi:PREDICTED: tripartite motif-containing protein 7-like, partial [Gekko japonicus]|uniref:RING-type E3 ubiquitin transferase n=1 Tax=Gekko japonicus TaxID=146911 RepID=A0ABM1KH10_GEKJA